MGRELGRISGPLLADNLKRNGTNLAFESKLLYLNVVNGYIGVNSTAPSTALFINGKADTTNLIADTDAIIANLEFSTNQVQNVSGSITFRPLQSATPTVTAPNFQAGNLKFSSNSLSNTVTNADIILDPAGTGKVIFNSTQVNVDGTLHATGNITWDGSIVFGDGNADNVTFSADVNSNIIPDVTNTSDLGALGKEWRNLYARNLYLTTLTTSTLTVNNINVALTQGHTIYVSVNGSDTNVGISLHGTYLTIKKALSVAVAGDEIVVFPGTYTEIFPLTVPQGVSVRGMDIRNVIVKPTSETNTNNAFLMNGETTVSFLTVKNFYAPGNAFSFASNFTVTTRSPYVQNITVITVGPNAGNGALVDGSLANGASKEAAMLFDAVTLIVPDAIGIQATNGARVEWINGFTYFANKGIYLTEGTGRLIQTGTTINLYVPNSDLLRTTALLESFFRVTKTSWESSGLSVGSYLTNPTQFASGTTVTDVWGPNNDFGQDYYIIFTSTNPLVDLNANDLVTFSAGGTLRYGAEMRSIGSANVYGTYGAYADGAHTLGYLIGHNFSYIGSGLDSQNDYGLVIQANEIVAINGGKLYYDSTDQKGDYRIGDIFLVEQSTGLISFNAQTFNYTATGSIALEGVGGRTLITSAVVEVGNIRIHDNNIDSTSGPVNVLSFSGSTYLSTNVNVTGNTSVTGDTNIKGTLTQFGNEATDTVTLYDQLTQNINPNLNNTYTLGKTTGATKIWNTLYAGLFNIDNVTRISNNTLTTLTTNTDLQLSAAGTGIVSGLKSVEITNNLTVSGASNLQAVGIVGTLDLPGSYAYTQTGDVTRTGNTGITGAITNLSGAAKFGNNVQFISNTVQTTVTNSDLQLVPDGTGRVYIPSNNVQIDNNLTVGLVTNTGVVTVTPPGVATATTFNLADAYFTGNYFNTATTNRNLELRANGTGKVQVPSKNVEITNDLTVNGTTNLKNVTIGAIGNAKALTVTGNYTQTGAANRIGNTSLVGPTNHLIVSGLGEFSSTIQLNSNTLQTISTNTNLVFSANGSGKVIVPTNNVVITNNLIVNGGSQTQAVSVTNTAQATTFKAADAYFTDNYFNTTTTNRNLELRANGTGIIKVLNNNVELGNGLTVNGTTSLKNTDITGTETITGNVTQVAPSPANLVISMGGTQLFQSASNKLGGSFGATYPFVTAINATQVPIGSQIFVKWSLHPVTVYMGTVTGYVNFNTAQAEVLVSNPLNFTLPTYDANANTNYAAQTVIVNNGLAYRIGNTNITGNLTASSFAQFQNIRVDSNVVTTTVTNTDLSLQANGSGRVIVPTNNVEITNDLRVLGNTYLKGTIVVGTATAGTFTTGDAYYTSNYFNTTLTNSNLELRANGTGKVQVPLKDVEITNNLTVSTGTTSLKNTVIGSFGNATTQVNQNLSGTSSSTGFFFYGWQILNPGQTVPTFSVIQPGWTVVGQPTWVVTVVGDGVTNYDITITGGVFASGGTYSFTGPLPSNLTLTGNKTQTGAYNQTGNTNISGTLTATVNGLFPQVSIIDNVISGTASNTDVQLKAAGTGRIFVPLDNVRFNLTLTVGGTTDTANINSSGTVTANKFKTSEITIENNSITTVNGNTNLLINALGTGKVGLENIYVQDTTISTQANNFNITITPSATKNLIVNSNTALKLPVGTTGNRTMTAQGELRFNSTDSVFSGFSTARRTFGGVYSADRLTYARAHPTNNTISFVANSTPTMSVLSDRVSLNGLLVDNNFLISGNILAATPINSDLIVSPSSGTTRINGIPVNENSITNTSTSVLTLGSTGSGYVKFTGTAGIVIPVGLSSERLINPEVGAFRYNPDNAYAEVYDGDPATGQDGWIPLQGVAATLDAIETEDITNLWALIVG